MLGKVLSDFEPDSVMQCFMEKLSDVSALEFALWNLINL